VSQSYPPPQPQPVEGNPYAQPLQAQPQPPAPGGFPPPAGAPAAYPPPPPAPLPPAPSRVGLGLAAGLGATVLAALAYGAIIGVTKHEIGYAAVGVGLLVGVAVGKVGGRNAVLPFAGAALAVLGVFLGQFFGEALIGARETGLSVTTILTDYAGVVFDGWKADFDFLSGVFLVIAAFAGFSGPKRVGN
jgi:hypothetical protein